MRGFFVVEVAYVGWVLSTHKDSDPRHSGEKVSKILYTYPIYYLGWKIHKYGLKLLHICILDIFWSF